MAFSGETLSLLLLLLVHCTLPSTREKGRHKRRLCPLYAHIAKLRKGQEGSGEDAAVLNQVLGSSSWDTHDLLKGTLLRPQLVTLDVSCQI